MFTMVEGSELSRTEELCRKISSAWLTVATGGSFDIEVSALCALPVALAASAGRGASGG